MSFERVDVGQASRISRDTIVSAGKTYKTAKDGIQVALCGAVYQASKGNPDWVTLLLRSMDSLTRSSDGTWKVGADGRQVFAYLTRFLGIPVTWDKSAGNFKMAKNWSANSPTIEDTLAKMGQARWDKFNAVKADKAFDEEKFFEGLISAALDPNRMNTTLDDLLVKVKTAIKAKKTADQRGAKFATVWAEFSA
jgi:hypothetical protein